MRRAHIAATVASLPVVWALLAACHTTGGAAPPPAGHDAGPPLPLAAGSPWPKFRGNARQDGVGTVHAHATGGAMWSHATGKGVFSSPVVAADGTIYVGSADRNFYALSPVDGTVAWKVLCGELIDSAALLDDKGNVYFGAGDGKLRALDARTGTPVWTMTADDPKVNGAYINWFEGNVGIGPDGTLYVPNDDYFVYAVDRAGGTPTWHFRMPDQTWSLPAVDPATGTLYVGNNNMVPILGPNAFSIAPDGTQNWSASISGTVAASPMLTPDGLVVFGAFDGYVHAYDASGDEVWSFATRDHVYASDALLPDGSIVAASADGSLYDLDPKTGALRWQFDTPEAIRSSPAVDADGNIYFGAGDGRLYVVGPDGKMRWSVRLIDADRNDLNSSPALGSDAIYLGGESGEIFSVPYEYCLRPSAAGDARCSTTPPAFAGGASLVWTTSFGARLDAPPASIDPTRPITLSLVVRDQGAATLAVLDSSKIAVTVTPATSVSTVVSGDGKFVTITPATAFTPAADGTVSIDVVAPYLVNLTRSGLQLSGGTSGGSAVASFTPKVNAAGAAPIALDSTWTLTRLSVPLPTVMPSYNQIGFDSLWYLLGLVERNGDHAVGWMVGGLLDASGNPAVDPASKAIIPTDVAIDGASLTLSAQGGLVVQITNIDLPFSSFRMDLTLDAQGQNPTEPASLIGSTQCAQVPTYGTFLEKLGLCNPQTDAISFVAAANLAYRGPQAPPSGVGTVTFAADSTGVTATLGGTSLKLAEHLASLLLVDATTGSPVTLGYALDTVRTPAGDGTIASVRIPYGAHMHPASVRAYLMIDTGTVATEAMALP